MKIHNRKYLKPRRKKLRNNLTPAEATFWKFLQGSQLGGRKFRRQCSVGNYILDFYCSQENLVIEPDGDDHFTGSGFEKDQIRENYLNCLKIRVLRFENNEGFHSTEAIFDIINAAFTTPPVGTPPKNRRGL